MCSIKSNTNEIVILLLLNRCYNGMLRIKTVCYILTWQGRYCDHKLVSTGQGSPIAFHSGCADPYDFSNVGNSTA